MRLGEISFCNHSGFNIKSDELKKKILDEIDVNFKKKIIQKHHEKFNESFLKNMNVNPYLMTLRSNGNPYFLYLTRYNGVNQCIFIDKKIQQGYFYPRMVIVKLWFHDALFSNTLFDGEMVKDTSNNWIFLIRDILGDSGQDLSSANLIKRINRCYEIFENQYIHDVQNVCHFQVKKYFHYHEFNTMIKEFMPSLPYSCRGIYFTPLFLKFKEILFNFDDSLVKKVHKHKDKTVTFRSDMMTSGSESSLISSSSDSSDDSPSEQILSLQKTNQPDIYDAFSSCGIHMGIACVNNISTSKLLRTSFLNKTLVNKIKFKCIYNKKFGKWSPVEEICV